MAELRPQVAIAQLKLQLQGTTRSVQVHDSYEELLGERRSRSRMQWMSWSTNIRLNLEHLAAALRWTTWPQLMIDKLYEAAEMDLPRYGPTPISTR